MENVCIGVTNKYKLLQIVGASVVQGVAFLMLLLWSSISRTVMGHGKGNGRGKGKGKGRGKGKGKGKGKNGKGKGQNGKGNGKNGSGKGKKKKGKVEHSPTRGLLSFIQPTPLQININRRCHPGSRT